MRVSLFRPNICDEAITAVGDVLRSGWLGLGPKTQAFEKAFAEYVGAPFCVALNSCSSALHLALRLLNLPQGAEVVTTALTFVSTNHAILYEGLQPVFADVQPTTGNLDVRDVWERITERTGAIMLVHYGGYPCDLDEFYALAHERGIAVIEDCAHACGATYKNQRIGSHGDLHAFSFHAVKNLPMGDGGALTVRRREDDARLRKLRWLGIDQDTFRRTEGGAYKWDYTVEELGFKYHMNDIAASIGLAQLARVDVENVRRAQIAARYREGLKNVAGVKLLDYKDDRTSSYHLFPVLVEKRDRLVAGLSAASIETGVHYKRNDLFPMYEEQHLPNAEQFWQSVVSLPVHTLLTNEEIDYVIETIRSGW